MTKPRSLAALRRWLEEAPEGTTLDAARVAEMLAELVEAEPEHEPLSIVQDEPSWRERLWTAPAETRLTIDEAAEAIGRPKSALYKLTSGSEIPFRKHGGLLWFRVGELRAWLRDTEQVVVPGRLYLTPSERQAEAA